MKTIFGFAKQSDVDALMKRIEALEDKKPEPEKFSDPSGHYATVLRYFLGNDAMRSPITLREAVKAIVAHLGMTIARKEGTPETVVLVKAKKK